MIDLRNVKIFYGDKEVKAGYLGEHQFYGEDPLPWVLASDNDFSGEVDGEFRYIGNDPYVEIPHVIKGVNVTSYGNMFRETAVVGVKSTNRNVTNMSRMFQSSLAQTIDIRQLYTRSVLDMSFMFANFRNYRTKGILFEGVDLSIVTDMRSMFYQSQIERVDFSGMDLSSVADMSSMFREAKAKFISLSNTNTTSLVNMSNMFYWASISDLVLGNFNISRVTNMTYTFMRFMGITDLSGLVSNHRIGMDNTFRDYRPEVLDLSGMNLSVTRLFQTFAVIKSKTIYVGTQADKDAIRPIVPAATEIIVKERV